MSLAIVGSVAYDAIETPYGKTGKILGGAGTYVSMSASYFHKNPNLISVVGGDFDNENVTLLKNHGVDLTGLQIIKDKKTFFWSGKYHNDMNNRDTLATELNVLAEFDPVVPEEYQNTEFLMLGNLAPTVQRSVIERLKNRPRFIAMDTMNFWMNSMPEELEKTISLTDILIINDEEARQLSGEHSLLKAAENIFTKGPSYLIIKKGEHGALLFGENKIFYAPALPLRHVFDPTGAGDTFAGGFIGYLAKTKDICFENIKTAVIVGSAMASFCVEKFGTEKLQYLKEEEINERLQTFVNLVDFKKPEL